MQILTVPVHAYIIAAELVASDLREHGFVVIETMRTAAVRLTAEVHGALGIDPQSDRGERLIHLSERISLANPADDWDWVDLLMYEDAIDMLFDRRVQILTEAMEQWLAAGRPDRYLAKVAIS